MNKCHIQCNSNIHNIPHSFLQFSHCMSDFQFSAAQSQLNVDPLLAPPKHKKRYCSGEIKLNVILQFFH